MAKVAIDAGHGINTPGKRTPDNEREWSFNNKVVLSTIKHLNEYQNVEVIRLDDPTGKTDISLATRTNVANRARADVLVSVHHNAFKGVWGTHTGTETYSYPGSVEGAKLAKLVQPRLVNAYGIRDRGTKTANFHMIRESNMPAILTEGGYMDSSIDIKKLRDNKVLDNAGKAIASGIADYLKLKKKEAKSVADNKPSSWAKQAWEQGVKNGIVDGNRPKDPVTRQELVVILSRLGLNKSVK